MSNSSLRFGLLGQNVGYSMSPEIFRAIGVLTGLEITFETIDIAPGELEGFIDSMKERGITGLAVTIPHKESIMRFLKRYGEVADRVRAVNSVHLSQGELVGYNTDWHGVAYALAPYREQIEGGEALLIGTGGAARAAVYAICADMRVKRVTVAGRTPAKIDRVRQLCDSLGVPTRVIGESKGDEVERYSLAINCTPLGGWHQPHEASLPETVAWRNVGIYFDLNYNKDNINIRDAESQNVVAVDGRGMLVAQAAKSFQLWTGRTVEVPQIYNMVFSG